MIGPADRLSPASANRMRDVEHDSCRTVTIALRQSIDDGTRESILPARA